MRSFSARALRRRSIYLPVPLCIVCMQARQQQLWHASAHCLYCSCWGNNSMCEVKLIHWHWHGVACSLRFHLLMLLLPSTSVDLPPCLPRFRLAPVELHASSSALQDCSTICGVDSLTCCPPLASRLAACTVPRICSVELPPGRDKASVAGVWCVM